MKNRLVAVAAAAEALTGLVLVVYPLMVIKLLFGAEITGIAVVISRFAGLALIALGVACWPYGFASRALCGMLTYSFPCYPGSSLPWPQWHLEWAASVAGSSLACRPNAASCLGLAQASRG